ncbi:PilT protein domain-containing protein [Thauera phenylacetica B4P]|uniref:Ribonuclease VapC n=1 Tax=Thauera phenylacetica B4P TaxID=1234382 RepID=N7A263_9RHOO|nr:type II toxin-antitoxin system VapC family toxin [Thauera phenylacetica]ENO98374.1 PilT protein domain-containing protein [Thauera phenylacetica B4P]
MPTVIDVNVLVALFSKNHDDLRDVRVQGLLRDTRSARGRLIIPAPALAEFAVKARDEELDFITSQKIFQIAPFDAVAALECGFMIREVFASERKEERRKIKFDLQILAIAKVCRASRLVSDDNQLRARAEALRISGLKVLDLPIPDDKRQIPLVLSEDTSQSIEDD